MLTVTPAQMAHADATCKQSLQVEPCNKSCAPGYCYCEQQGLTFTSFIGGEHQEPRYPVTQPIIKPEIKGHNVEPPPEAQTEAEKIAYCAGWWAAMEAKRQWQSLTEEEVFHVENNVPDSVISDRQWTVYFASALDAALRRKNHG
jgi:hypothetical protein